MQYKAKLNIKFYIVSMLLFGLVIFIWYGVYFLNTNVILMDDDAPMSDDTKLFFTVALSIIGISWTISLITVIRQIVMGTAFIVDENGIHYTATAINIFAFIFVIPVKTIPYSAITKISNENGILTVFFDKDQIKVLPILRFFARKQFSFFYGFTTENLSNIESEIKKYINI